MKKLLLVLIVLISTTACVKQNNTVVAQITSVCVMDEFVSSTIVYNKTTGQLVKKEEIKPKGTLVTYEYTLNGSKHQGATYLTPAQHFNVVFNQCDTIHLQLNTL